MREVRSGARSAAASAIACWSPSSDEPPGPEWRRRPEERELLFVGASDETIERWLDEVAPRTHHVITSGAGFRAGIERAARRLTGRSLGLVLSGGGARGLAHIGALAALADAGFVFDRIGGCSMGSFIAAMAALGHDADEIEATCSRELVRRSPFNDYTLPRVSLIRARKAGVMLDRVFGSARMESLERPLYTVSADLISSLVVVHRRGPIFEAVGASMNLPGLVPPLRRNGRLLVDGGVLNNLPVDHMAESNEGPIVAVDVVRRVDAGESEQPLPSITETLARATVLGSVERAERNRALALVLVTPEVQGIALREWSALAAAVEAGRRAAEETLEAGGSRRVARCPRLIRVDSHDAAPQEREGRDAAAGAALRAVLAEGARRDRRCDRRAPARRRQRPDTRGARAAGSSSS